MEAPDLAEVGQQTRDVAGGAKDTARSTVDEATKQASGVASTTEDVPSTPDGAATPRRDVAPGKQPSTNTPAGPDAAGTARSLTNEATTVMGRSAGSRETVARPKAPPVTSDLDVTHVDGVSDVTATASDTGEEKLPADVDLGDLGTADAVTRAVGTADSVTQGTLDSSGLTGITDVTGVLDTAAMLTTEIPGVATVDGSSATTALVAAAGDLAVDRELRFVDAFGTASGTLEHASALDVDAGDLGYLSVTADLYGWVSGIGAATLDLASGDTSGFLSAVSGLEGVLTTDGQLADLAGLSGTVTTIAVLDGFVDVVGNVAAGDLSVFAGLSGMLDGAVTGTGWVAGVGDLSLSSHLSSTVSEVVDVVEVS